MNNTINMDNITAKTSIFDKINLSNNSSGKFFQINNFTWTINDFLTAFKFGTIHRSKIRIEYFDNKKMKIFCKTCDCCKKCHIITSIRYGEIDLCLKCISDIVEMDSYADILTTKVESTESSNLNLKKKEKYITSKFSYEKLRESSSQCTGDKINKSFNDALKMAYKKSTYIIPATTKCTNEEYLTCDKCDKKLLITFHYECDECVIDLCPNCMYEYERKKNSDKYIIVNKKNKKIEQKNRSSSESKKERLTDSEEIKPKNGDAIVKLIDDHANSKFVTYNTMHVLDH